MPDDTAVSMDYDAATLWGRLAGANKPIDLTNLSVPLPRRFDAGERDYLSFMATMNNLLTQLPKIAVDAHNDKKKVHGFSWEHWSRAFRALRWYHRFWTRQDSSLNKSQSLAAVAPSFFTLKDIAAFHKDPNSLIIPENADTPTSTLSDGNMDIGTSRKEQ